MRSDIKRLVRTGSIFMIVVLIASYGFYQSRFLLKGPELSVWDPTDGSAVLQSVLEIKGEAKNISYISLDGRQIFVNEEGAFKEKVLLSPGYNALTFKATDKFGKEVEKTIGLFFKETEGDGDTLTRN